MKYQDTRINGVTIKYGERDCESRYNILSKYCKSLNSEFSVCDIGANMSYFGLRLIEDFNAKVLAFEFNSFEKREKDILKNKTNNLMYVKRKIKINDLRIMNKFCHFDIILAMSVLHHINDNTTDFINEMRKLGDNVIIEFALDDSNRSSIRKDYYIPNDAIILGYGISHLKKDFNRPIVLLTNKTTKQ